MPDTHQTIDNPHGQNTKSFPVYVTIPRVSQLLGVSTRRLRLAIKAGAFPVYTMGTTWPRVRVSEVQRWIESTRVAPTDHAAKRVDEVISREASK